MSGFGLGADLEVDSRTQPIRGTSNGQQRSQAAGGFGLGADLDSAPATLASRSRTDAVSELGVGSTASNGSAGRGGGDGGFSLTSELGGSPPVASRGSQLGGGAPLLPPRGAVVSDNDSALFGNNTGRRGRPLEGFGLGADLHEADRGAPAGGLAPLRGELAGGRGGLSSAPMPLPGGRGVGLLAELGERGPAASGSRGQGISLGYGPGSGPGAAPSDQGFQGGLSAAGGTQGGLYNNSSSYPNPGTDGFPSGRMGQSGAGAGSYGLATETQLPVPTGQPQQYPQYSQQGPPSMQQVTYNSQQQASQQGYQTQQQQQYLQPYNNNNQQQSLQPYNQQQQGNNYGLQAEVIRGAAPSSSQHIVNPDQFRGYNPGAGPSEPSMYGLHAEMGGGPPSLQHYNDVQRLHAEMGGGPPSLQHYNDVQRLQDQQFQVQQQAPPPAAPPLFTLDQIPTDQGRFVKLLPHQANDVLEQVMMRPQDGHPPPQLIDVMDTHAKFMGGLSADKMTYLHQVELAAPGGRLPPNSKPSLLQTKLKSGHNRLQDEVVPVLEPGAQSFVDLGFTTDGALLPETSRIWQFSLKPVKVEGVGPTGLRGVRSPCMYVARVCLFDRANHRFLGNVMGFRPMSVVGNDTEWTFDQKANQAVVRCNCVQPDSKTGTRLIHDEHVSLYVEFNTSYRLTVEDTKGMPPSEKKAFSMVDEVCSCWAMINFQKCTSLSKEMTVSVPLYYGSLYKPQLLDQLYKAERKKSKLASLFRPHEKPVFTFKAGPLGAPGSPAPLLPYGYMPSTLIALSGLADLLAAYRLTLALHLGRMASPFSVISDPVLAAFPAILSDHHLLSEVLLKWNDWTEKMSWASDAGCLTSKVLPPIAFLVEAFRRCCLDVAPLVSCVSLPPRHINNFVEYQGHRLKLVQQYCHVIDPKSNKAVASRHPVEPLSHSGFEFLHKPFNTNEVRVCLGNKLEKGSAFLSS